MANRGSFADYGSRGATPRRRVGEGGACIPVAASGNAVTFLPYLETPGVHAHDKTVSAILASDGPRMKMKAASPLMELRPSLYPAADHAR
jgi:hypothetical protein